MRADLRFIDEHAVEVDAPPDPAWRALPEVLARSLGGRSGELFARLLGTSERSSRGRPDEPGSTLPGFRVARVEAPVELALEGEHRFSSYALIFRLDQLPGERCRVRAETRALFPGLRGRIYRMLVIGTRGHVLVVNRLLRAIKAGAERPAS